MVDPAAHGLLSCLLLPTAAAAAAAAARASSLVSAAAALTRRLASRYRHVVEEWKCENASHRGGLLLGSLLTFNGPTVAFVYGSGFRG